MIRVKKAFTLVELMLVVILISVVYALMISTDTFKVNIAKDNFSLQNIRSFLLDNYTFNDEVSFVCVEEDYICYVSVDGQIDSKMKIENVFKSTPDVYEYNQKREKVDFVPIRIDDSEYSVIFEFKINNDFKSKDYILDTLEDRVYVFNSIFSKAKIFESLSEAFEIFEKNSIEVRDAF